MKINRFTLYTIGIAVFFASCATHKAWYDKSQRDWAKAAPPDTLKLLHTVFLVGDVGVPEKDRQEPTLKLLQQQVFATDSAAIRAGDTTNKSNKNDAVIFLGDNIYEDGLPEPDAADRKEKERRIIEQMNVVKGFKGRAIILPGNHDWKEGGPGGLAAVNRQEQFVEAYLDSADVFLPSNGCGGPEEVRIGNDMVIIVIDSQWWLHKYEKPLAPDNGCDVASRQDVIAKIKDILVRNKGKNIVMAQHHPLYSNGVHGGHFTVKDYIFPLTLIRDNAWVPLPVIGSIYPLMRQYGLSRQDLSNKNYQQLKRGILSVTEGEKNLVFAAGHEHALQFNKINELNHVITGAGSKQTRLIKGNGALFTHGTKGFSRLNYYNNGQCWIEFWEPVGDGSTGKLVYRSPLYAIPPKGATQIREEKQISYKDSTRTVAAGDEYTAGKFKRQLFGEHYRASWAQPVTVKYLDPSVFAGGLTPLKMGGGHQTTSLQLEGKDKHIYQFRLVNKDPSKLLDEGFQKTFAEDILQDQISSAHPYGALMIPDMAKAIGIYYTQPQLVYMPYSRLLGPYLQQVGGRMGYIEARPDEDVSDLKSFGNAANAISTRKLYEKVEEDNDNEVDQAMYVKARLFDILIGDWDRHEDQWRWAEFKKEKGSIYRPIPRDRDQAFVKYDGALPKIASKVVPGLQSFEYEVGSMEQLAGAARNLDRNFLNKLPYDSWRSTADEIKLKLTDAVIEASVRKMPPEAFSISGPEIIAKLKARRDQLSTVARDYYGLLAQNVRLVGTDKKEFIRIEEDAEATRVQIYKINKDDKIENKLYDRRFFYNETREIAIYGLGGKDSLVATGRGGKIRVRFVGGDGQDFVNTDATQGRVIVYDTKSDNTLLAGGSTSLKLSDKEWTNAYNRDAFEYDKKGVVPYFDYNYDDGIFLGGGYALRKRGFRKEPFASEQNLVGNYAPKSGAYTIRYRGIFYSVFGQNRDFILSARWNGPKYTFNYYGQGNSTSNLGDDNLYYRTRTKNLGLSAYFQRRFSNAFQVGIGPGYEYYRVEQPADRFVSSASFPEKVEILSPGNFATLRSYANIEVVDNPLFPGAGVRWNNDLNYFYELGNTKYRFLQFRSVLSFYFTPNIDFPVTAALRVGGAVNAGDYKFYQSNTLGSNNYLRGFRNSRFAGRSFLFQNTELRFKLTDIRNYIFTGNLGAFAFLDAGRVYSDVAEANTWHTGYGPGVWINLYHKFMLSGAWGISKEEKIITLKGGLSF